MAKLFIILAATIAVSLAQEIIQNVNCPQNNGPIADPSDCSKFYQCDNGLATRKACPAGLEFNPQILQCDFPSNNPNPACRRLVSVNQRNAPCAGLANTALVAHSSYCNAFMVCGNGFLYDGCSFCASGQYFDAASQRCMSTYNVDTQIVCTGKQMIPANAQEISRLDGSCWPSEPSRFVVLIEKIRRTGGGFRPVIN